MSWTVKSLEDKVRELLGDEESVFNDTSVRLPPLVDVYSRVTTPAVPSPRPIQRRLTPQQTAALINRLAVAKKTEPVVSVPPSPHRSVMNPKSAEMAQGLERIDLRAPKLLKAKERRLERLAEQRRSEEDKSVTGQPTINQKSREIAQRLTPARRQQIVEQRRQLLLQEAAREKENCSFKPKIDSNSDRVASRRNSFSVTHRLLRDVEMRKHKHERLVELRERELMADCRDVPEISHVGKSFFVDAPVHERLFSRSPPREEAASTRSKSVGAPVSRTAMPFSQYWGSVAQPMTESVQLGRDSVQFVPRDSVQLAPMESSFFKSASPRRYVTPPVPSVAELKTTRTPGVRTQTLVGRPEDSTRRSSRLDLSSVFAFTKRSSN